LPLPAAFDASLTVSSLATDMRAGVYRFS
jgi:hypothetical protein